MPQISLTSHFANARKELVNAGFKLRGDAVLTKLDEIKQRIVANHFASIKLEKLLLQEPHIDLKLLTQRGVELEKERLLKSAVNDLLAGSKLTQLGVSCFNAVQDGDTVHVVLGHAIEKSTVKKTTWGKIVQRKGLARAGDSVEKLLRDKTG